MAFFQDLLRAVPQAAMMTMSQNSGIPLPTQMTPQSLAQFVPQAMAANRQRQFYGDMMAANPTFATQYFTGLENQARTKLAERQLGLQETEFNTQQRRQAEEDARTAKREQAMQALAERMRASNGGITDYLSDFASVFPEKGLPMLANYKLEQEAARLKLAQDQAKAAREQADIAMRRDMLANLAGMRTPGINPEPQIRDLKTLDDVMAAMEGGEIQSPMQAVQQPSTLPPAPSSPMTPKALAALQIAQMNPTDTNLMKAVEAMSETSDLVPEGVKLPEGTVPVPDPSAPGGFRVQPIAGIEQADQKSIERRNFAISKAKRVINKVDESLKIMKGMGTGGAAGQILQNVGGTNAYNLRKQIDTIKGIMSFEELQKMREMSPTGGALGSVAVRELELLGSTISNLDIGQTDEQLAENLNQVKVHYNNWLKSIGVNEKISNPDQFQTSAGYTVRKVR